MGGTKSVTYTDLQISRLMDNPSDINKNMMKEVFKKSYLGGKMMTKTFGSVINGLKGTFNDGYLNALGYNPSESVNFSGIDEADMLLWCRDNISQSVSSVRNYSIRGLTYNDYAIKWLQENMADFDIAANSIVRNGKTYLKESIVKNGVKLTINFVNALNSSDIIIYEPEINDVNNISNIISMYQNYRENLGANVVKPGYGSQYYYGDTYEYNQYNNSYWNVSVVSNALLDSSGSVVINTKIESSINNYFWSAVDFKKATDNAIAEHKLKLIKQIKAEVNQEYVAFEYLINGKWIFDYRLLSQMSTLDMNTTVSAFPIIPLKSNYSFSADTKKMKAITNKLGLSTDDFRSSLSSGSVHTAFISFTVPITSTHKTAVKYLFEYFDRLNATYGYNNKGSLVSNRSASISYESMGLTSKSTISKKYVSGVIGPTGTYSRVMLTENVNVPNTDDNGNPTYGTTLASVNTLAFRKQTNEEYYEEITVSDMYCETSVAGYVLKSNAGFGSGAFYNDENVYVPLLREIIDDFKFQEYAYMFGLALSLIVVSVQVVKIKWYQSGFFKFVLMVVGAVAAFYTGGVGGLIIYMLLTIAVIAGWIRGTLLKVVTIAMILYGGYQGISSAGSMAGTTMAAASTLTQLATFAVDWNTELTMKHLQNKVSEKESEKEKLDEEYKETMSDLQENVFESQKRFEPDSLFMLSNADTMCNYDILYDTDSVIESIFAPE